MYTFVTMGSYGAPVTAGRIKEAVDDYRRLRGREPAAVVVAAENIDKAERGVAEVGLALEVVAEPGCLAWEIWLRDAGSPSSGSLLS